MQLPKPLQQTRQYAGHLAIGLISTFALLLVWLSNLMAPVAAGSETEPVRVVIPAGASAGEIAHILAGEGLIKSELLFRALVRWEGVGERLQAGQYELSPGMTPREIIACLAAGDVIEEYVRVTIPEGYTVVQIADLLARESLVDRERFLEVVQSGEFEFDFIDEIPGNVDYRLEGYLFPDTYYFLPGMGEEAIIHHLLQRFDQIVTPEIRARARESGMTLHEVVTLASIVEREARLPEERPIIASVFYNRLSRGMKLRSCATIQYILGEPKERLLLSDLQIPSPYNTYLHAGLPPGPIAAPGKASLLAVVYPADTDFLYFVARNDGSHTFSRTLEEHNRAKRED